MQYQQRIAVAFLACVFACERSALAAWKATGPFGGDAAIVRVLPSAPDRVIAAARNGLLFSSRNGGATWTGIAFPGQFSGVLHALEVDPKAAGTWYAGTEGERAVTSGVYRTTDFGQSWQFLPGMQGKAVWSLALLPSNARTIAAGTADGIYESTDAGDTWKLISPAGNEELRPVVSLAFHPTNNLILYAGTTHLPWRTSDGGVTWKSIHTGMLDDSDVFSIVVNPRQPEMVYASACSGVYHSSNGAGSWTKLTTPSGAFRTHFVSLDPRHDRTVFAGTTEGLLRSEDNGKTWRVASPLSVTSIAFDATLAERIFFASPSGGLMVSTDGGRTLRESNVGFTNRNFTTIDGSGSVVYANSMYEPGSGGVYRTDDMGLRWKRPAAENAAQEILIISAAPESPAQVYAAGYRTLRKSADGGKTWNPMKGPDTESRISALTSMSLGVLLVGTDQGLYQGNENAWTLVAELGTSAVRSVQRSAKGAVGVITAAGAFVSGPAGAGWQRCGEPDASAVWYGLALDSANTTASGKALAATSVGLFRSTDSCLTWSRVSDGLRPAETVGLVLFHPTHAGEAYASQGGRIFRSLDSGNSWTTLDDSDEANSWPAALIVLPASPERLFALFPRRGIFSKLVEGPLPATAN